MTGGCNGYSFTLNYAEEVQTEDEVVEVDGTKIYIEPKALFHTVGTRMDFHDTPLASEFVFENPNATGKKAQRSLHKSTYGLHVHHATDTQQKE